ncbi:uncharacterized protein Dvar_16120 [Desulfosarcina variabilis str. Montpellier]
MVIVDTMPYEAFYKKEHVPGTLQLLFPILNMNQGTQESNDKTKVEK